MGVFRLSSFCQANISECSETEILANRTLLVDYNAFLFYLCDQVYKDFTKFHSSIYGEDNVNPAAFLLLGGDNSLLREYCISWLTALQNNRNPDEKNKLIFIRDLPSSVCQVNFKEHCQEQRRQQKYAILKKTKDYFFHEIVEEKLTSKKKRLAKVLKTPYLAASNGIAQGIIEKACKKFPMAQLELNAALKELNIPCHTAKCEADQELAELNREGKAYAVISEDSDFLVMKGVKYIPFHCIFSAFPRPLEKPGTSVATQLNVPVFRSDLVATKLGIPRHQLVDLSILCGNDFSEVLFEEYGFNKFGFPTSLDSHVNGIKRYQASPIVAAQWLQSNLSPNQSLYNGDPDIQNALRNYPETMSFKIYNVLHHIYSFYGYTNVEDDYFILPSFYSPSWNNVKCVSLPGSTSSEIRENASVIGNKKRKKKNKDWKKKSKEVVIEEHNVELLGLQDSFKKSIDHDLTIAINAKRLIDDKGLPCKAAEVILIRECYLHLKLDPFIEEAINGNQPQTKGTVTYFPSAHDLTYFFRGLFYFSLGQERSIEEVGYNHLNIKSSHTYDIMNVLTTQLGLSDENDRRALMEVINNSNRSDNIRDRELVFHFLLTKYFFFHEEASGILNRKEHSKWGNFANGIANDLISGTRPWKFPRKPKSRQKTWILYVVSILLASLQRWHQKHQIETNIGAVKKILLSSLDLDALILTSCICCVLSKFKRISDKPIQEGGMGENNVKDCGTEKNPINGGMIILSQWYLQCWTSFFNLLEILQLNTYPQSADTPRFYFSAPIFIEVVNQLSLLKKTTLYGPLPPQSIKKIVVNLMKEHHHNDAHVQVIDYYQFLRQRLKKMSTKNNVLGGQLVLKNSLQTCLIRFAPYPTTTTEQINPEENKQDLETDNRTEIQDIMESMSKVSINSVIKEVVTNYPPQSQGTMIVPSSVMRKNPTTAASSASVPESGENMYDAKKKLDLQNLPVFAHREEILSAVHKSRLVVIQGETGCGKSTSIPQFLLDNGNDIRKKINVYVTQPRRVAAVTLAQTVAKMRNELTVGKTIGYRIGQEQKAHPTRTQITYVTTGYLLERLLNNADSIDSITHIILDEAHERAMDMDLLLLVLKLIFPKYPHLKLIIMSATMDANVFVEYFQEFSPHFRGISNSEKKASRKKKKKKNKESPTHDMKGLFPVLFVGTSLHEVEEIYVDMQDKLTNHFCTGMLEKPVLQTIYKRSRTELKVQSKALTSCFLLSKSKSKYEKQLLAEDNLLPRELVKIQSVLQQQLKVITPLVQFLLSGSSLSGSTCCILVFVPGISQINALFEELTSYMPHLNGKLFVLYSQLEMEEQQKAFEVNEDHSHHRIILSTNIAESSVTIPGVNYVINCGLTKQIESCAGYELLQLTWCSEASCAQRRGRAGRVRSGVAFNLFPKIWAKVHLEAYSRPEILRKPLRSVVLQLKAEITDKASLVDQQKSPSQLLAQAISKPDLTHVEEAVSSLYELGCFTSPDEKTCAVTKFGLFAVKIPLDLRLARLLCLGHAYHHSLDALILCCVLSLNSFDIFTSPSRYHCKSDASFMEEMSINLQSKMNVLFVKYQKTMEDSVWSEPLAIYLFYRYLIATCNSKHQMNATLKKYSISFRRFNVLQMLIADISTRFLQILDKSDKRNSSSNRLHESIRNLIRFSHGHFDDDFQRQVLNDNLKESGNKENLLRLLLIVNFSDFMVAGQVVVPENDKTKVQKRKTNKKRTNNETELNGNHLLSSGQMTACLSLMKESGWFLEKTTANYQLKVLQQLCDSFNRSNSVYFKVTINKKLNKQNGMKGKVNVIFERIYGDSDVRNEENVCSSTSLNLPCFPLCLLNYIREGKYPINFDSMLQSSNDVKNHSFPINKNSTSAENSRPSSDDKTKCIRVNNVVSENTSTIKWRMCHNNSGVQVPGRSLAALPVLIPTDQTSKPNQDKESVYEDLLYAVPSKLLYLESSSSVRCENWTLFPLIAGYMPMIMLLTASSISHHESAGSRNYNVWLLMDKSSKSFITGLKISRQIKYFPKGMGIRAGYLHLINLFRRFFHTAIMGDSREEMLKKKRDGNIHGWSMQTIQSMTQNLINAAEPVPSDLRGKNTSWDWFPLEYHSNLQGRKNNHDNENIIFDGVFPQFDIDWIEEPFDLL